MNCLLCNHSADFLGRFQDRNYNRCTSCASVFLDTYDLPSSGEEKERYDQHINSAEDKGYLQFLKPLIDAISANNSKENRGLDFGSGPNPVLTQILKGKGYKIDAYDPFYLKNHTLLNTKYDYIVCCEVMEHFHQPAHEFHKLRSLLKEGGKLYCKTNLLEDSINFEKWWYKNDFTHSFFYTEKALKHIKETFDFKNLERFSDYFIFTT